MAPQGCDRARLRIFFGLVVLVSSLWLMIADIQAQSLMNQAADSGSVVQSAPSTPLAGWSTFQIKKTPAELAETARLADDSQSAPRTGPRDVSLPPQHDVFRLSTGIGYLQGADLGGDVSGSGKISGLQTDVSAFFTGGPLGVQ